MKLFLTLFIILSINISVCFGDKPQHRRQGARPRLWDKWDSGAGRDGTDGRKGNWGSWSSGRDGTDGRKGAWDDEKGNWAEKGSWARKGSWGNNVAKGGWRKEAESVQEWQEDGMCCAAGYGVDTTDIPVIDFGKWYEGGEASERLVADITDALREFGFFYVVNHHFSASLIKDAEMAMHDFFNLDQASKDTLERVERYNGYFNDDDVTESYQINMGLKDVEASLENKEYQNQPDELLLSGFRNVSETYMITMGHFAKQLMRAIALSINLKEDTLDFGVENANLILRYGKYHPLSKFTDEEEADVEEVVDEEEVAVDEETSEKDNIVGDEVDEVNDEVPYHPLDPLGIKHVDGDEEEGEFIEELEHVFLGCGAHTDFGTISILWQDSVGLESLPILKSEEGEQYAPCYGYWAPVHPLDGSFVVNIGEEFEKFTQNLLLATPHRVVQPELTERHSIGVQFEALETYKTIDVFLSEPKEDGSGGAFVSLDKIVFCVLAALWILV